MAQSAELFPDQTPGQFTTFEKGTDDNSKPDPKMGGRFLEFGIDSVDTVTPANAPGSVPNAFPGLDKSLEYVMNNYQRNLDGQKEADVYTKKVGATGDAYDAHLPERKELLSQLKVPKAAPAPQFQERSPIEALGSLGAVVGALGSLFSRRPMTAALKSMAAGMDALYKGDVDDFGRKYKTWEDQTNLALKQADLENGIVKTILDDDSKSWDQKLNLLKGYGSALNDKRLFNDAAAGDIRQIIGINEKKIDITQRMQERMMSMSPEQLIFWKNRQEFVNREGREPTAEEELTMAKTLNPALAKEGQRQDMLKNDPDWQSGDPERMRRAYQRTEVATHPMMSQFGFGQPQMVLTRDAEGKPKTVLAQQVPGTGQWYTADEKREPIANVERILPQGSPSPTDPSVKTTAKMIANYEMPLPSGYALREPYWQAVLSQVNEENPKYDAAQFPARSQAVKAFSTGKQGNAINSFNVAIDHLNTLQELGNALNNSDIPAFNRLANKTAEEMGYAAPTSFEAAKQIVGQEIVKAIVAGGGGVGEREEAGKRIDKANSPAQLSGVIKTYKDLMAGQLKGLRKQYEDTTGLKNFDDRLFPATLKELQGHPAPSASGSPAEGDRSKSKSGRDIIFRGGKWEYQ